jgi:hypothetical protein
MCLVFVGERSFRISAALPAPKAMRFYRAEREQRLSVGLFGQQFPR